MTKPWTMKDIGDQNGKVILITGANTGLGLGCSVELAKAGAELILAVRDLAKGEAAVAEIKQQTPKAKLHLIKLDLADLNSVRQFAAQIKQQFQQLDVLLNNAGVMMPSERRVSTQGYELQLATNHFGHFVLTKELWSLLDKTPDSRVVVVSSLVTNMKAAGIYFDDIHFAKRYDTMKSYAQSKLANLMFVLDLAAQIKSSKSSVKVLAAHPGYTATDLQRHMGLLGTVMNALLAQNVSMGILPSLRACVDNSLNSGEYIGPTKFGGYRGYPEIAQMTELAHDESARQRLWNLTEQTTNCQFSVN